MNDPINNPKNGVYTPIKYIAWISLIFASISIIGIVLYSYNLSRKYEIDHASNRVTFKFKRDSLINSYSKTKIYINGTSDYNEIKTDSTDTIRIQDRISNGFRPISPISARIYTIANDAIELRIEFKEGSNSVREFPIQPTKFDCGANYPEYTEIKTKYDSLRSEMYRLSRLMDKFSPTLKYDSTK